MIQRIAQPTQNQMATMNSTLDKENFVTLGGDEANTLHKVRVVKFFRNLGTLVENKSKYGLLDLRGRLVVPCVMDAMEIIPDLGYCYTGRGDKRGLYTDEFGYIPTIYDNIVACGSRCEVVFHGMTGYLDTYKKFVFSKDVQLGCPSLTLKEELAHELHRNLRAGVLDEVDGEYRHQDALSQMTYGKDAAYVVRLYGRQIN